MKRTSRTLFLILVPALLLALFLGRAGAAQRVPGWWDPDGVGSGSDWHYRVPVTLGATSSANATAKVDVDFAALMVQLGISGSFDPNSVRVVRPGGSIAAVQEYNDAIYAGASDSTNTRGEVRWIVEDGGAPTYYVYFDVTQNGSKSANPQTPINGNFEQSASGTQLPAGWASATRSNSAYDLAVRPSETISVTDGTATLNNPFTTDGTPQTGSFSYLMGARSNNEPTTGAAQPNTAVLSRTFTVPASNPGNFTINWRVEGWDAESYDNLTVTISGNTTTTVVGNALASYTTIPNAPNIGGGQARNNSAGFGQYNGFDMSTGGTHQNGMTVAQHGQPWWNRSVSLAAHAGQTVTLTIAANNTQGYRTWFHIDNVEWSVIAGTLGSAEGYGVAVTGPAGSQPPGKVLTVSATVDAKPTAASNPVTADLINGSGTAVASAVRLYNDGTHGDATANDAVWTNNGSDAANPTYTMPLSSGSSSGWILRVYARDASTSTQGQAGMVHRNGQGTALVLANWWSIDEGTFSVDAAAVGVTKAMTIISDGVGASNYKAVPGAQLRYCVTIGNSGTASAGTVLATDSLPSDLTYVAGSLVSGSNCASAATAEDDDAAGSDETDPIGASFAGSTITISRASLPTATSFAVLYRVTVR
ncbi:hypothetical protein [Novosphingobium sp.]|uniref:hypothetical protein n=1 Tax=Novosphingobium sp. TaxID=1874826 RepID=UPI00286D66D5|nr:hypothetical protein [Novosphingobium sp.]